MDIKRTGRSVSRLFFLFSITVMSVLLCACLSVRVGKSYNILHFSDSLIFSGRGIIPVPRPFKHLSHTITREWLLLHYLCIIFWYSSWATLGHSGTKSTIVSSAPPHNRHKSDMSSPNTIFHLFVHDAWFCAGMALFSLHPRGPLRSSDLAYVRFLLSCTLSLATSVSCCPSLPQ